MMKEWQHILGNGQSAPILLVAANVFFTGLFEKVPTSGALFKRVNVA
ncbi:hypothetical protein GH877_30000, partial [Bacillus thuringiensis]|nr:hypothetical protein [Bacillus thuringiensis]